MHPRLLSSPEQILYSRPTSDRSVIDGLVVVEPGVYEYYRRGHLVRVEIEPGGSYPIQNCHQISHHRVIHYKNGVIHRDHDLPAIEDADGERQWYQHGYWHRDGDKPASIRGDFMQWRKYGLLHRDKDQPASVCNGRKAWWHRGYPHRLTGPATIEATIGETWHQYGQLHREDGPAIVDLDGSVEWYLRGRRLHSQQAWEQALPQLKHFPR